MVGTTRLFEQCDGRHDLSRRAIPALIAIACYERSLHRVHRFRCPKALDSGDLVSVVHQSEVEAREHAFTVHMHRTCAALTVVTALLRSGQRSRLTYTV